MNASSGKQLKYLLFPLFLAFLSNFNVLFNQFVWDDSIILNQQLPAFQTLHDVFSPNLKIYQVSRDYYRPFITLSYLTDFYIWGKNPFGFHLTVFLFHLANTAMVFFLSKILLLNRPNKYWISAITASIFATHPIHVENVAWIAGRTDVICAFFMFLSMYWYIDFCSREKRSNPFLILSGISLFLALLIKEVALSLVLLIPIFHYFKYRAYTSIGRPFPRFSAMNMVIPLSSFIIYYLIRREALEGPLGGTRWTTESAGTIWQDIIMILGFYLKKLIFPFPLQAYIPDIPSTKLHLYLSFILLSLTLIFFLWAWLTNRWIVSFSFAWILITLSPSLLVAFSTVAKTPLAERYLYVPSFGFCLLLSLLIIKFSSLFSLSKIWVPYKKVFGEILLTGSIVISFGFASFTGNKVWRNNIFFWSDLVKKIPNEGLPHNNLGHAYLTEGRLKEAAEEFKLALQHKYNNYGKSLASSSLGNIYRILKKDELAERYLQQSIQLNLLNHLAFYYMGNLYMDRAEREKFNKDVEKKHLENAEFFLTKAIQLQQTFLKGHYDLGIVYIKLERIQEAKSQFQKVIDLGMDPNSPMVQSAKDLLSSRVDSH